MNRDSYCPYCKSIQRHKFASDEFGGVLWCQRCFTVHLPSTPKEICGDCHYWHLSQCLNALAMLSATPIENCPFRRPRREQRQLPCDF